MACTSESQVWEDMRQELQGSADPQAWHCCCICTLQLHCSTLLRPKQTSPPHNKQRLCSSGCLSPTTGLIYIGLAISVDMSQRTRVPSAIVLVHSVIWFYASVETADPE